VLAVIVVAAVAMGTALRLTAELPVLALIEGLAFTAAGVAALSRWPERRIGRLLAAYPFLDWSYHLSNTTSPLLWTLSQPLFLIAQGLLAYLILTFPRGRVTGRAERVVLAVIVVNVVYQVFEMRFFDPVGRNLWVISTSPRVLHDLVAVNPVLVTLVTVPTLVVALHRWWSSTAPGRRVIGPMLLPAAAFIIANRVVGLTQAWYFWTGRVDLFSETPLLRFLQHVEDVAVIVLPVTFLAGLARSRLTHGRVSRLVVELGDMPSTAHLEEALQRALRDDALRLAVWDQEQLEYVDGTGRPAQLPSEGSSLVATRLEGEGRPLALMIHDEALLDEPGLVEATAVAARLALDNERLQAEVRSQLDEVRASRHRIVAAQDDERRRIERDLHDGAQQRLIALALALQVAESSLPTDAEPALRTSLSVAAEEVRAAIADIRELAHGIHPAMLTQRGLRAALHSLAERSAVPVVVDDALTDRLPAQIETAAYFVAAEALANVAKHAHAALARVVVAVHDETLILSVSDDGIGIGSDASGSGLRGLEDRVRALGGSLVVTSASGAGTSLEARLPLRGAEVPGTQSSVGR
jgi:signal transduction histidine kinase